MTTFAAKTKTAETDSAKSNGLKQKFNDLQADSMNTPAPFFTFPIQRKAACACGGGCPSCQTKSSNLPISQPTDSAEIEADQIADKVMRFSADQSPINPTKSEENSPPVQAKKDASSSANGELAAKILSLQGGSNRLDGDTRSFMESRFKTNFGDVKIRTDAQAVQMSRALDAKAFTVGSEIYFNEGEFNPHTQAGRHLLAHELAHVAQQQKAGQIAQPRIQRQPATTPAPVQQTPAPQQKTPSKSELDEALSFMFRTEDDIPAAKRGELNSPFMIWCVKSAFNIGEDTAARIVSFVGWQPVSDTRTHKKGEFIKYTLKISGIIETYKILAGEGIVDEQAVQKFEGIFAMRAQMTEHDRTFFDKAAQHQFSNLNVDAFTVTNLGKIKTDVQNFMLDKESVLAPLGLLDDYYRAEDVTRDLDFEALKDRLHGKKMEDLTQADKEEILSLMRVKMLRKVFRMLEESNLIAQDELTRYQTKRADLDALIDVLSGTVGPKYTEVDKIRAQVIKEVAQNADEDMLFLLGQAEDGPAAYAVRMLRKGLGEDVETIAVELRGQSKKEHDANEYDLVNGFALTSKEFDQNEAYTAAYEEKKHKEMYNRMVAKYPDWKLAKSKEAEADRELEKNSANYKVLKDVSIDFRIESRKDRKAIEEKIIGELHSKKQKSQETKDRLIEKPWLIWEFQPLIERVMAEEGLSGDDVLGKVIQEKVKSVQDHKFWRSIGIAALGLAMGIAGFFTGGTTWVGFALIAGSVTLNLIDLHYELQDYALHSSAAEATFEGGLTNAPSSIGVIFAIGALVLDFIDALKFVKGLAKELKTAKEVEKYAADTFKELAAAGKLKPGVTQEMFVKELVESWQKREKMISKLLPEVKSLVEADAFKSLHQGVQEGLFRVFDKDPDAFTHLIKTFGDQPEILTRFGSQAMLNPHAAENIVGLHKFLKDAAPAHLDEVLRYYGSVGERALHNLDNVLDVLRRGNIPTANPELTKLILTNRNLQQSLLTHAADPDTLLRYWEQYQTTLSKLPPDSPVPDFVKFLDEEQAGTKLAEASGGVAQKVEFSVSDIKITAQLGEKDLATVNKVIQRLVKEKGFISPEQMQAIIRTAEAADLTGTISKNLRGVLYQLNNAYSRIANVGMKQDSIFALLRGLENADEFSTALKFIDHINSGASGLKTVDGILSSMKVSELGDLIKFSGEAVEMGDVYAIASKIKISSNASGEVFQLMLKAGESGGKFSDVRRLRYIVESLGDEAQTVEAVEKAIAAADVFDVKVAEALAKSEGGLEEMTKLVWGEKALKKSGSAAYNTVLGNPEKARKIIKGVISGTDIDPVKWAVLRKTIEKAEIPQSIKNNIIGELWTRAGIESYTAKGFELVDREVEMMLKTASEVKVAKADAVMKLGDEIYVLEFKTGEAVFSEAQEVIYPLVKKGEWQNLRIANPALEKAVKAAPEKVKFIEVREPYNF